jgi:lipid-A-disaccharide synthase-like uncharacterized protein
MQFINWVLEQLATPLVLFGFAAQFVFFLRFAVQWYESEKRGQSHIPIAFWWLSIAGAIMILIYATWRKDLVIATANVLQLGIYGRNLMLIYRPATNKVRARPDVPVCGQCGYVVRGISSLTCPECGSDLREVGVLAPTRRAQRATA